MARRGPQQHLQWLYRRGTSTRSRVIVGAITAVVIAFGVYLAFSRDDNPFAGPGYELSAVFRSPATLTPNSPVRIAGVAVGKVTAVEREGDLARVTFTVDEAGQPVHSDATVEVRPRLFLEGNFFLDFSPGSPSAPELASGSTLPSTQTSVAVQLDQVLTALQTPERRNLQRLLQGFGTALTHEPTATEDADQDPDVQGETAAEALNDAFAYGGEAGMTSAVVTEALQGEQPHEVSRLIAAQRRVFGALLDREAQLKELITNFNVTAGALAAERANLSESVRLLAPTLETTQGALAHLNASFPQLRAFAVEARPGVEELAETIAVARPWLRQADPLLSGRELGGLADLLRRGTPDLAKATDLTPGVLRQLRLTSRCVAENLIPAGDVVIDDAGGAYPFSTGVPNYQELFYGTVGLSGESQAFDGNSQYVRFQSGGGPVLTTAPQPGGGIDNGAVFGYTIAPPIGTRPALPAQQPPFRPDFKCHENPVPDINGAPVGPPSPQAIGP
jgi:phospholipid/cholesterol/gamma-HCH transport system substrate-binding protein